mmetsp:Transcript_6559/g.10081  ORF Transcript_6559/g.10081 Transcript_6559/m.10081 type:complete len:103 (-) Transcript_6559:197-505(-)|eukprot:CAMPEP_0167740678 /NCGR_PEP_ID=MMETSP0110_2-20121227/419_1 /TAXON_ID=629695 /ORGANISM="Gymnochlora sp., Strain CCMP2014" /LENGTH=102 /DNA_ID=CAMNT_0007624615 /DNA_START=292 /DNA_END=600 /DNA_ORIENTATION=+
MAVETIIEEQFAVDHAAKGKDPKDDGPAFALLAICLSIAMWAYEGGWVAGALAKAWSGFPTLLTVVQLSLGLVIATPVICSMGMMLLIVATWLRVDQRAIRA